MLTRPFLQDPIAETDFKVDNRSHIKIKQQVKCANCEFKPCTYICPSQVYEYHKNETTIDYPRCLECGACVIACPKNNIDWDYPRGGWGVIFKY